MVSKKYQKRPEVAERRKEWVRQNLLTVNGKAIRVHKRPRPYNTCEICKRKVGRLSYHHWDNEHLEQGLWVCYLCHHGSEFIDKGLGKVYLTKKEAITMRQSNLALSRLHRKSLPMPTN